MEPKLKEFPFLIPKRRETLRDFVLRDGSNSKTFDFSSVQESVLVTTRLTKVTHFGDEFYKLEIYIIYFVTLSNKESNFPARKFVIMARTTTLINK